MEKRNNIKVLLCTIVKEENNYLQEFIDYYRNLGFTNIVLYDNNDIDGEKINIKNNEDEFVIIENIRGVQFCQFKAYNHCWKKYKTQYDWIAFFDVDEYLYFNIWQISSINDFLNLNIFNNYDCIKINWKTYGDNDQEKVENNNYSITRFKEPLPIDLKINNFEFNSHVKVIVRCKNNLNVYWDNPHCCKGNLRYCNNNGQSIYFGFFERPDYTLAELRHYYTKTIDEYINKIDRGYPDTNRNKKEQLYNFFQYNKMTKYKETQMNNYLYKIYGKNKDILKLYICSHKEFDKSVIPYNNYEIIDIKDCDNKLNDLKLCYSEGYHIYDILYNRNIDDYKYIGICHYRRFYDITEENIINYMNNYDCIVTKHVNIGNQTVYEQYKSCFDYKNLLIIGAIIKKYYPEYLNTFDMIINSNLLYAYNMCILKVDDFKKYYTWLFDILDKFINYYNWKNMDDIYEYTEQNKDNIPNINNPYIDSYFKTIKYNSRLCAHLMERLMTVYIIHNFSKIKEVPLKFIE